MFSLIGRTPADRSATSRSTIVLRTWMRGPDASAHPWFTGRQVGHPLTGHTDIVRAVAVGRLDGRDVIVSASTDQTVRIWDSASRPLTRIDLLAPCSSLFTTSDLMCVATGSALSVFTSG